MPYNSLTITGNLVNNPELRFTPNGKPVARFTLAYSERYRDNATGEWKDGDKSYFDVYAWDDLGEHVAETFAKGNRAIVTGTMRMRTYEVPGEIYEKRRIYEIRADDVGPSLRFATAKLTKATRPAREPAEDTSANGDSRPADGPASPAPAVSPEPAPGEPERPAEPATVATGADVPRRSRPRSGARAGKPAA